MKFLGHTGAICSFSLFVLVAAHAFGADPNVTYALVDASDPTKGATTTFEVSSFAGFTNAVSTVNAWTTARTVTVNGADVPDSGVFTISLQADLSPCPGGASFTTSGTTTTLLGNGHKILFTNAAGIGNDMYFYVANGAILRLGVEGDATASALDITRAASNSAGPLYVLRLSTIHIYDGVVIHDCVSNNHLGGAITVEGGLLYMHGGIIRNCGIDGGSVCHGGGVAVVVGGRFVMDDGVIKDCFASSSGGDGSWMKPYNSGGGVFVYKQSSFIMNGGTIDGCSADNNGASSYGMGGGVAVWSSHVLQNWDGFLDSAFMMNGGTITNCSASYNGGGVAVSGYHPQIEAISFSASVTGANEWKTVNIDGGDISEENGNENPGPGGSASPGNPSGSSPVLSVEYAPAPGLYLNGGNIADCDCNAYGGGVFLFSLRSSVTNHLGTIQIAGCAAGDSGGGIATFGYYGPSVDGSGVTISKCKSYGNAGGGIYLGASDNSFQSYVSFTNLTVTGCWNQSAAGGIYYNSRTTLSFSGACAIADNTAEDNEIDSNLNCLGHSYPFYVSGSLEGSVIGLTDPLLLADGADSDIFLSSGYDANNPSVHPYARVFTSDHEGWYADYGDKGELIETTKRFSLNDANARAYTADVRIDKAPPTWGTNPNTGAPINQSQRSVYWNVDGKYISSNSADKPLIYLVYDGHYYLAYRNSFSCYQIAYLGSTKLYDGSSAVPIALSELNLQVEESLASNGYSVIQAISAPNKTGYTFYMNVIEPGPDYSAEVRLVKGGATLTGARQRYPWNNFIDFSWTAEGRAGGWLFDFSVEDLGQKDVTTAAALKDAADTTRAAGDAVAGENRVAWDAPADGFARMATNCVVTMKCYRDAAERTAGTPFVTGVISNLAFDTHYDFTTGGYGVRVVADPATDILPITYSATNFVWKGTDVADATGVYGVLANTNEAGAFFDCSSTNLLNSAAGEGAFGWHGNAFDFVKLVHSNELGQTVAYFKFPPLTFTVTQRELEEEGKTDDDAKRSIILSPKWLEDYGIYKVGATDEEVEQLLHDLDTVQPNGCRMWENVVLGNVLTNLLVATVPTMEPDALKLALPMTSPAPGYGYKVLYELRRAKVGMVQRDAQHENLHIDLHKDERTDANDPTGLYRIWALVIPDADAAVTNAIPSTNMVGVLKVASTLTNTVTAVPWVALAGDPAVPTNMAAEASLHVANLSAGDQLLAYDAAQRVYYGWTRTAAGSWEPQTTVTERDGVALAAKPENFRLARGSAFWVVRGTPRDGDTAQAAKPYFLYGQHLAGTYEQTLSGGSQENPASSLCANPTPNSVDLNALQFTGSVGNNDTIALNMDGATSTVFVRNKENTEWGRYKKSRVNGYIQSVFVKDGTIPPGRGFWYVRRAEGNLKLTWPGWSEQ